MKKRINFSIDVTQIDKSRLQEDAKGRKWLNLTSQIDEDNPSQYGDHGFITQQKGKDEAKDLRLPILGNAKIVWREGQEQAAQSGVAAANNVVDTPANKLPFDDVPF